MTDFALPTVSHADMSAERQGALILNQAVAAIVVEYIKNATATDRQMRLDSAMGDDQNIVNVVNRVQEALRTF